METLATHGDVQAVKYENGAHHLYEVDPDTGNKRHLGSDEFLQGLGYEPTPSAYARNAEVATPENTAPTQIPVTDAAEAAPATPLGEGAAAAREIGEQMNGETDDLVRRLDEMLPEVERTIEQRFDDFQSRMDERFAELSRRFDQLDTNNDGNTAVQPPAGAESAAQPAEASAQNQRELGNRIGDPGQAEIRGQAQDGTPYIYRRGADGQWEMSRNGDLAQTWFPATAQQIANELGLGELAPPPPVGTEAPAAVEPVSPEQPTEATAVITEDSATAVNETVEDNSLRARMGRAWDRMRNIASGRSALAALNSRDSERLERTSETDRRRPALGFLAAGMLIGAAGIEIVEHYLEGKHGVPSPGIGRHLRENSGGGPAYISHVEHFRGNFGHNRTGVELSGALHLRHLPTHDIIVDNQGHTVVGQLKEGIGDRQGNLSRAAKEVLKARGYKITQNGIEGSDGVFRYMSEVA